MLYQPPRELARCRYQHKRHIHQPSGVYYNSDALPNTSIIGKASSLKKNNFWRKMVQVKTLALLGMYKIDNITDKHSNIKNN